MSNGNGGGFGVQSIFSGLLGILRSAIQFILNFLVALVRALVDVFNFIFKVQKGQFDFSLASLVETSKGFHTLFDQILAASAFGFFSKVWDIIGKVRRWVGKLKGFLDRLHRIQQIHQLQAMRRVINLIQRIRKILVIFRIFHLKFATKLDRWLAGIEGKIIRRQFEMARKTNEIIGWLNVILDPRALLRTPTLLNSLGGTFKEIVAAIAALGLTSIFPGIAQLTGPGVNKRPWSHVAHRFHSEVESNSGGWGEFRAATAYARPFLDSDFDTGRSS